MTAVLGGTVLVLVMAGLAYAVISAGKGPKDVATLSGSNSAYSGPSVNSGGGPSVKPYVAPASAPAQPPPVTYASAPAYTPSKGGMRTETPESVSGAVASNSLLTVKEARFRVAKTAEGKYILYGEADIDNASSSPVTSTRFSMKIGESTILLSAYSGDIYRPELIEGFSIPVGKTTVFIINEDVPASILKAGDRTLKVDGKSADGPIEGSILIR